MAIITINKKQFEKEIGKLTENMQNKIAMFGTPVEDVSEEELQLEIFPNRPDMLSYHGFKRAFLAFLGKKTGIKKYPIHKPEKKYYAKIDFSVKNIRPYTSCAVIKGLKLDDDKIKEIIEIQEKLHTTIGRKRKKVAIGIYPLEKIKMPITFKALEPDKIKFIPLETNREMSGLEILQKHPAGKEYAHLLAGKTKFPVFTDAEENILSMPPIINSQLTGRITDKTKNVFVECSGFDFPILSKCLNIITTCLEEMGGKIYQMEIRELQKTKKITPDLTPEKIKISLENTNKLLGLNLHEKKLKKLLEKMGHHYAKGITEIPSWRTDILHEVDLIEDVAIAYGYENFSAEIPQISTIGKEDSREKVKRKIAEILTGAGILEVSNYHLTNKYNQFKRMNAKSGEEKFTAVESSKTEFNILRKNLAHLMMKNFSENVDSEYPQKIFEVGKIFETEERKIIETENLTVALSPANFTEIKQVLDYLFKMLNISYEMKETELKSSENYFIDGRTAKIILTDKTNDTRKNENDRNSLTGMGERFRETLSPLILNEVASRRRIGSETIIGLIGEIHPKILKNWRIKMPVALLEINLEDVFKELK